MPRLLAAALILAASCSAAMAADGAQLNVIGYSPDSRYFAFEEYGVQDGSGFPYWNIYVLDLQLDRWIDGAPVKVTLEDETLKLADARRKARAAAEPLLSGKDISDPGEILAANPATEVVADRRKLAFDRYYLSGGALASEPGAVSIRHELVLQQVKKDTPAGCDPQDGPYFGFNLALKDLKMENSHVFHSDEDIPATRGCVLGYDLSAVVAPSGTSDVDQLVAIVGVYSRGFEGSNHRYIALPFVLSD